MSFRVTSDDTKRTLGSELETKLNIVISDVRLPYPETTIVVKTMTKSYIWWLTNPWAAFVAIAVMIILICIINFVVIVFSYSRSVTVSSQIDTNPNSLYVWIS